MGFRRRRRWHELVPEKDTTRVNRAIRVAEVRVINAEGQQLGIMTTETARDIASRIGLDLVEISPGSEPPVCKIMDYGRYKYEQQKKATQVKKGQHQSQLKEVKLRPFIDEHDLEFKLNNARRFFIDGDKVKITVVFRGREMGRLELGHELLQRVTRELADCSKPEAVPQMEGRMLTTIFAPDRRAIEKLRQSESASPVESADEFDSAKDKKAAAAAGAKKERKYPYSSRKRGEETLEDEAHALMEEIDRA